MARFPPRQLDFMVGKNKKFKYLKTFSEDFVLAESNKIYWRGFYRASES